MIDLHSGVHLWTIPVEFRCSMLVFVVLVGLAGLHAIIRLSLLSAVTIYCLGCGRWDVFCSISELFIAETSLIQQNSKEATFPKSERKSPTPELRRKKIRLFWTVVFQGGRYLRN